MKKAVLFFFVLAVLQPLPSLAAPSLAGRLSGRIVLQVQSKGEAWYISPADSKRYFLGRPADAFELMKRMGVGATDVDLKKIPIGFFSNNKADSDSDGLSNDLEIAIGANPNKNDTDGDGYLDKAELAAGYNLNGAGKTSFDSQFAARNRGRIFLQIQGAGEAWYISPTDFKRYFLGRPNDAFVVMRSLGLGISNIDLEKIAVGVLAVVGSDNEVGNNNYDGVVFGETPLNTSLIEQKIHVLINAQRAVYGLPALEWNDQVAAVAREHSADLAKENQQTSDLKKICNYAIIHHEGLKFGLMPANRLGSRSVNYFSKAGENIALIGAAEINYLINFLTFNQSDADRCAAQVEDWNNQLKTDMEEIEVEQQKIERLNQEISTRKAALAAAESFKISDINWKSDDQAAAESVTGWMNSPGHRANILDSDYNEAGIGVAYVNGYIIATQVFIKRASCGYINGPCCERNACYLPTVCGVDSICR